MDDQFEAKSKISVKKETKITKREYSSTDWQHPIFKNQLTSPGLPDKDTQC